MGGDRVDVGDPPREPTLTTTNRGPATRALADAPVVRKSGGEVDDWLDDLVESAGGDAREVT